MSFIFVIEFGSDGRHLATLEVGDLDGLSALGCAGHGGEHELEQGFFAEGVGGDFQAPTLSEEEAREEVRIRYKSGNVL